VKDVEFFVTKDTKFKGEENSGTALELIKTNAEIVNSTFVSNRQGSYRKCVVFGNTHVSYRFPSTYIGGAIIIGNNSVTNISQSMFEDNEANLGGVIFAEQHCIIYVSKTIFVNNNTWQGGVLASPSSTLTTEANYDCDRFDFIESIGSSNITISASKFYGNRARDGSGGVLYSGGSDFIVIKESRFYGNVARSGGVLLSTCYTKIVTIEASEYCQGRSNTDHW
jgi:acetyltransferase-like isoleucine patch superfamily enzyme